MTNQTACFLAGFYVTAGLFTYGYVYNESYVPRGDCGPKPSYSSPDYDRWNECKFPPYQTTESHAAARAYFSAIIWPLHWSSRAAVKVTETLPR